MGEIVFLNDFRPMKNRDAVKWSNSGRKDDLCKDIDSNVAGMALAIEAYTKDLYEYQRKGIVDLGNFPADFSKNLQSQDYQLPEEALMEIQKLTIMQRANIILDMLAAMHDVWANTHHANFFSYFVGQEFIYLPIELIGTYMLQIFYDGLKDELSDFGLNEVTFAKLVEAYQIRRKKFLIKNGIHNVNSLRMFIPEMCMGYKALKSNIKIKLCEPRMAKEIAIQIFNESPSLFA